VIVAGNIIKRGGKLIGPDVDNARKLMYEARERLRQA
jgi:hypothetical protein